MLWATPLVAVDRYVAWLADGTRLTSRALSAWPVPGAPFRLENRDLLEPQKNVRLVRDRWAGSSLKAPYLVMANGDVIGGTPVQLERDGGRIGQTPRLRVQLEPPLLPVTGTGLAVRTDRLARIVASADAPAHPPPPGTVALTDGRRLVARAIRWREYGLAILTAGGIVEAAFGDLEDVVFPEVDVVSAVTDDNLWAGGASSTAIGRFQTAGGAVVTAARVSREQEQTRRRGRVTNTVFYYAQPAWTDQPLAIPEQEIVCCGYRAADEAPLSLFAAEPIGWRPSRPAGRAEGELFAATNRESDIGLAVHAPSHLAFHLPAGAISLELAVGLDQSIGAGGCVRCKVIGGKSDDLNVLWDSGVLQGKDGAKASGLIDLHDARRLSLVTETAHAERPPGADPFDIRDDVVWLAPLVRLDLAAGGAATRALAVLPGAADWQPAGDGWHNAQVSSRWNVPASNWDSVIALGKDLELKLNRKLRITRACDVVELLTVCPVDLEEHLFTLEVNGSQIPWHNNADRNQLRQWTLRYSRQRAQGGDEESNLTDRLAYWWDLSPWRGQEVELSLTLRGAREKNEIAWRGLSVRSAIGNLPDGGEPLAPDTLLPAPTSRSGNSSIERVRLLGQNFKAAWLLRRGSGVEFPLEPDARRFVAVVGCPEQVAGPVQVLIDGRVAWERASISSLTPAEQIEIAIAAGAKSLTLRTGQDGLYYGAAAFADAGFVR
jgi:NPCBM/NEW2 domain